ncbi:unnamed protein product [Ectocarpus sp. 4 AP-2014]
MRAASFVTWPSLQTAFARSIRGGGAFSHHAGGFHTHHMHTMTGRPGPYHLRWRQPQKWCNTRERRYDGLCDPNAGPRRLVVRCLNRIMLEPSEVVRDEEGNLSATLPAADSRTAHVRGVLKVENGESVRIGVVNAGRMDDASITWEEPTDPPEGAPPPDIPGRQEDRKSSPTWMDLVLDLGPSDRQLLKPVPDEQRPKVALMLAVPRPLQLERILPVVASLGVTTIVLCQAKKVPKFYFGSHFFRDPPSVREKLIEGLSQSGDTVLPEVMVARRLKIFLEDDLDRCFPRDRWVRALAHPTRLPAQVARCAGGEATAAATAAGEEGMGVGAGEVAATAQVGRVDGVESDGAATAPTPALRFSQIEPPKGCDPADVGVLVAVGPEGGWVEPDELQLLQSFGFQAVTLGSRVLRSDVAVNALLALAHAWVDEQAAGTQYFAVQQGASVVPGQ